MLTSLFCLLCATKELVTGSNTEDEPQLVTIRFRRMLTLALSALLKILELILTKSFLI